jgi:hypothetical protein
LNNNTNSQIKQKKVNDDNNLNLKEVISLKRGENVGWVCASAAVHDLFISNK